MEKGFLPRVYSDSVRENVIKFKADRFTLGKRKKTTKKFYYENGE